LLRVLDGRFTTYSPNLPLTFSYFLGGEKRKKGKRDGEREGKEGERRKAQVIERRMA